uniref:F-box protein family-like protein n=1 Tax=Brachypodium sylvaticum TaxID=29664 RepID=C3TX73_BRASY|nr:F-box protein family-like protein [Brachypodium sylvaticum]
MDRGKRAVEWPPRPADKAKKPCCATVPAPELSSLLSSLFLANRHGSRIFPGTYSPRFNPVAHQIPPDSIADSPSYIHPHPIIKEIAGGSEICCDTDMDQDQEEEDSGWSSFLPELLRLICCRLPLADVPRFAAVCRHWSSCAFPVYPADASPLLISTVVSDAGTVRCYDPRLNKMFVLATPLRAPDSSRIFSAAADGWVMLRTPRKTVLFANLLDGSMMETPQPQGPEEDYGFMCCGTARNDPKDCSLFNLYANMGTVKIQSWDGENRARFETGDDNDDMDDDDMEGWLSTRRFTMSPCCSPVLRKGLLYCLGKEGNLGVYDPSETRWRVLPKPTGFGSEFPCKSCYLMESQGELLAALTGKNGTPIYVLKLNERKMAWERMSSLGGRSLFTGAPSSLSMSTAGANKVYLPRFYGRPQVIQAEVASSGGRLFFVAKQEGSRSGDGVDSAAWCYDLESESDKQFTGSKNLLQYVWVHLGRAADPDDGMDIG